MPRYSLELNDSMLGVYGFDASLNLPNAGTASISGGDLNLEVAGNLTLNLEADENNDQRLSYSEFQSLGPDKTWYDLTLEAAAGFTNSTLVMQVGEMPLTLAANLSLNQSTNSFALTDGTTIPDSNVLTIGGSGNADIAGVTIGEIQFGLASIREATPSLSTLKGEATEFNEDNEHEVTLETFQLRQEPEPGTVQIEVENPAIRSETGGTMEGATHLVFTDANGDGILYDAQGIPVGTVDYANGDLNFSATVTDSTKAHPVDFRVTFETRRSWVAFRGMIDSADLNGLLPDAMAVNVEEMHAYLNTQSAALQPAESDGDPPTNSQPTSVDFSQALFQIVTGATQTTFAFDKQIAEVGGAMELQLYESGSTTTTLLEAHTVFTMTRWIFE